MNMTSGFEAALNETWAAVEKQRDDLVRMQRGLRDVTGSARSPRRQVSAIVDARGEVTELKFHGQGYRTLPPAELANVILDTIREARTAAQTQLWSELGDLIPDGVEIAQVVGGDFDWADTLHDAMSLPQPLLDLLAVPGPNNLANGNAVSALFAGLAAAEDAAQSSDPPAGRNDSAGRSDSAGASAPRPRTG